MSSSADVVPQSVRIHSNLHLAGVVILYFDYALTFGEEYWRIWQHPRSMSSILFFVNRYLPLLGDIAVNVGNFYEFPTELGCRRYAFFRQLLLIINQVVVCFILFLRTFALYGRSWRVGGTVLGLALALLGVSCWSIVGQHSTIELRGGCHTALDHITAVHIAVSWESLFVFDLMIFSLTLFKTYHQRRRSAVTKTQDIVSLVMRDGAMYFAVMATANLANTLTFYFAEPLLRGCLSTAASSISVTMMSRLMLNLHASASSNQRELVPGCGGGGGGGRTFNSSSTDPSDNSTSLFFTSRISMPALTLTTFDPGPGPGREHEFGYEYDYDARVGYVDPEDGYEMHAHDVTGAGRYAPYREEGEFGVQVQDSMIGKPIQAMGLRG